MNKKTMLIQKIVIIFTSVFFCLFLVGKYWHWSQLFLSALNSRNMEEIVVESENTVSPTIMPEISIVETSAPETATPPVEVTPVPEEIPETEDTEDTESVIPENPEKIVYLTFDDGPSKEVTPLILDILKQYNVQATFFIVGSYVEKYPDLILREYEEGHTIANHSYSHIYENIYTSDESLMDEIYLTQNLINNILGFEYDKKVFRFPGGSYERKQHFKDAVLKNGYTYYDWNCSNGDAMGKSVSAKQLVQNTINTSEGKDTVTVLMHDLGTKKSTPEALPEIIEYFRSKGYIFKTLE